MYETIQSDVMVNRRRWTGAGKCFVRIQCARIGTCLFAVTGVPNKQTILQVTEATQ